MKKNKLKFFVVDDDPFSSAIFRQYLIFEGYRDIHVFNNGEDCIKNLHLEPDVILLDHFMLPLTGLDVLKIVKQTKPGIYVLYVSSSSDPEIITCSLSEGAFSYIEKGPYEFSKMLSELNKIKLSLENLKQSPVEKQAFFPLTYNRNNFSFSWS